jgi:hypothetical protein
MKKFFAFLILVLTTSSMFVNTMSFARAGPKEKILNGTVCTLTEVINQNVVMVNISAPGSLYISPQFVAVETNAGLLFNQTLTAMQMPCTYGLQMRNSSNLILTSSMPSDFTLNPNLQAGGQVVIWWNRDVSMSNSFVSSLQMTGSKVLTTFLSPFGPTMVLKKPLQGITSMNFAQALMYSYLQNNSSVNMSS